MLSSHGESDATSEKDTSAAEAETANININRNGRKTFAIFFGIPIVHLIAGRLINRPIIVLSSFMAKKEAATKSDLLYPQGIGTNPTKPVPPSDAHSSMS